jgi:hypothetical protein
MIKEAGRKVLWLAKGAALFWGAALTLALVLGVGTMALAAVPGDPFKLGRTNTINNMTTLIGSASDTLLRINNNGGGPALDLRVEEGEAPMNVNSAARVDELNADQLDDKGASDFLQESTDRDDFLPNRTYLKTGTSVMGEPREIGSAVATCDAGDTALTGGYIFSNYEFQVDRESVSHDEYSLSWLNTNENIGSAATPKVTCADFPPLR